MRQAVLRGGRPGASSAVLVLHGGRERGHSATSPRQLAYLRMVDLYLGLRHAARDSAVYLLRHRVRGWNAEQAEPSPVTDARAALAHITDVNPGVPIALLGYSMGGRTAFAVASTPGVVGVCALAPWLPAGEPLPSFRSGQRFVVGHGSADETTSAAASRAYVQRLREHGRAAVFISQDRGRHALLDRPWDWHRFAVRTTAAMVGATQWPRALEASFEGSQPAVELQHFDG